MRQIPQYLRYGVPAAAGLATGGYALSQGEDPGSAGLAAIAGGLGGGGGARAAAAGTAGIGDAGARGHPGGTTQARRGGGLPARRAGSLTKSRKRSELDFKVPTAPRTFLFSSLSEKQARYAVAGISIERGEREGSKRGGRGENGMHRRVGAKSCMTRSYLTSCTI